MHGGLRFPATLFENEVSRDTRICCVAREIKYAITHEAFLFLRVLPLGENNCGLQKSADLNFRFARQAERQARFQQRYLGENRLTASR